MQAIQKFIQFTLILVVTLAAMGMQVKLDDCHGALPVSIGFAGDEDCCCEKPTGKIPACQDIACIAPSPAPIVFNTSELQEQKVAALKAIPVSFTFTQFIRPVLAAKIPHFTLPPPDTGRFIRILHQTFII